MARPDFTKKWAGSRPSIPEISAPDYALGFAAYLGAQPPTTDDHDYIMNLQDERAIWLSKQVDPLRVNVATASTVNLLTSAPDTRNIRLTGSTTVNGFTILAGQRYLVTAGGNFTLTNGSSIITSSGADLFIRTGDSFEIIAISDNVVAVLLHSFGVNRRLAAANGYRVIEDGTQNPIILQWGAQANSSLGNGTITLPITFNVAFWAVTATVARVSVAHTVKLTVVNPSSFSWEVLNLSGASVGSFSYLAIGQ